MLPKLKAVINNGGQGTRLSEITKGVTPKGHIPFQGIPLIVYQIRALVAAGVESVLVVNSIESDREFFLSLKDSQLLPEIEIETMIAKFEPVGGYTSPHMLFHSNDFPMKVANCDVLMINSDSAFTVTDLSRVIARGYRERKVVVTYADKPAKDIPFEISNGELKQKAEDLFLDDSKLASVTFYPCNVTDKIADYLKDVEKPHIHKVVNHLLNSGEQVLVELLGFYINMNTILEYNELKNFIDVNPEWL